MNKRPLLFLSSFLCFQLFFITLIYADSALYKEGQVLVKYKNGLSDRSREMIARQVNTVRGERFEDFGIELIELPYYMSVEDAVKKYRFYPKVEAAGPNYYIRASLSPNDTSFSNQWALNNTGQTVNLTTGTSDADIDAPEAWDASTGSSSVVIALLDTGMDLDNEDLSGNLWVNGGETAGNGIDDDGNGRVDDVNGWDFVNSDNDPEDDDVSTSHGTFMSGIIGAVGNNAKGVCGVNWTVKIMPLKVLDSDGTGTVADAIAAISYAKAKSVKIINASWALTTPAESAPFTNAIENSDALFVTPAGNNGRSGLESQGWDIDNAGQEVYPASSNLSNIIAVAATHQDDGMPAFSNYGLTSVDVAAPGVNIYSTIRNNNYGFANGTSASCAYVSGMAGLMLAVKSSLTVSQLKDQIMNSVDVKAGLNNKVSTGGRINVYNAINAPSAPGSLSANASSSSQINISWSDNSNNELGFKIERKTGSGSYSQITTLSKNSTSYSDTGLSSETTYTYRIRSYNNINDSAYSNEASDATSAASSGGGGGGGGGGCFIATASFGSPLAEEVMVLSAYRDKYMMNSSLGCNIIDIYYRLSPYISKRIEKDGFLKILSRFIIRGIVRLVRFFP